MNKMRVLKVGGGVVLAGLLLASEAIPSLLKQPAPADTVELNGGYEVLEVEMPVCAAETTEELSHYVGSQRTADSFASKDICEASAKECAGKNPSSAVAAACKRGREICLKLWKQHFKQYRKLPL